MKFHELANIFPLMEVKRLMACAQNIKANGLRDQIVTLGDKILDGRFVWVKDRTGTGYWNMNQHELLLVGTRGNVPAPAPGARWSSVIAAPRGAHSEKPERAYELIKHLFPNLPKIEMNARRARPNWDCWGFEAPAVENALLTQDGQQQIHHTTLKETLSALAR